MKGGGDTNMIELLIFGAVAGGIGAGYAKVRKFVRTKLRFVDAVQSPLVAVGAGAAGARAAAPVAWLLPVVGGGSALLFGAGVGLAVRHGARDVQKGHRALPEYP
jgi:hypothetical protein